MDSSQADGSLKSFPKVVLGTFTFIGLLIKIFLGLFLFSTDGSIGSANTTIWGNLIIIISLMSYISIDTYTQENTLYPIILLIMMLMWQTSISFRYFDRINKREIPQIYYNWSFFSNMMTVGFILMLLSKMFTGVVDRQIVIVLYVIGFFTLFIIGIQQTILDNFMVDVDN